MKHPRTISVLVAVATILGGCVVSRDAVIAESDATFDARLLGAWRDVDDGDGAVVTRGASNGYVIEYSDKGKTGRLEARLGRVGDRLVLDVWPAPRKGEVPEPYEPMLLPAHVPVLIDIGQDEVRVWLLDVEALRAEMQARPGRWSWEAAGDRVVLRGTTAELRAALGPYLGRVDRGKPGVFRRAAASR